MEPDRRCVGDDIHKRIRNSLGCRYTGTADGEIKNILRTYLGFSCGGIGSKLSYYIVALSPCKTLFRKHFSSLLL